MMNCVTLLGKMMWWLASLMAHTEVEKRQTCTEAEEKYNLCQTACGGIKNTFDGDVCKITKGAMVMAHDKKVLST